VRDQEEANEAIAAGTDVVMLDSIEGSELASVAPRASASAGWEGKKFLLETSGGITESNLRARVSSPPSPHTYAALVRTLDHFIRVEINVVSPCGTLTLA